MASLVTSASPSQTPPPRPRPCSSTGQIERALHTDPRTHKLGIRVEVNEDDVVLHGQVESEGRRRLVAQVAEERAPGLAIRSEVSVRQVLPREAPEAH
jgi:hypothetical protein